VTPPVSLRAGGRVALGIPSPQTLPGGISRRPTTARALQGFAVITRSTLTGKAIITHVIIHEEEAGKPACPIGGTVNPLKNQASHPSKVRDIFYEGYFLLYCYSQRAMRKSDFTTSSGGPS
jgi:hypothetical protein